MIAEAIDVAVTCGWWLAGWIVVLAAVGTVILGAAALTGAWAWRALSRRLRAPQGDRAPFLAPTRHKPAQSLLCPHEPQETR